MGFAVKCDVGIFKPSEVIGWT